MKPSDFRRLALALTEAVEAEHMGHPDFRVGGKVFASLGYPNEEWGVAKLTPDQQDFFIAAEPKAFEPAAGAWGRRGYTKIKLAAAKKAAVKRALEEAWRNTAPKKLQAEIGRKLK